MSDGPKPPRYEARDMGADAPPLMPFVVFDTFTQTACVGESYSSQARAAVAASRLTGAYIRAHVEDQSP